MRGDADVVIEVAPGIGQTQMSSAPPRREHGDFCPHIRAALQLDQMAIVGVARELDAASKSEVGTGIARR